MPQLRSRPRRIGLSALSASILLSVAACADDGRNLRPPPPGATVSRPLSTTTAPSTFLATTTTALTDRFTLSSPDLPFGGALAPDATCDGAGRSPELRWSNVPPEAGELVLVATDLSAEGRVLWWVAGIDPATTGISPGRLPATAVAGPAATANGWEAPCPEPGGIHDYLFTLSALAEPSGIEAGADPDTVEERAQLGSIADSGLQVTLSRVAPAPTVSFLTTAAPPTTATPTTAG